MAKKVDKAASIEETTNELLSLMGTKATAVAFLDKENNAARVNIDAGDETGLLIGRRGETINAIQGILGIILKQKTGEWTRVIVNVGDYREKEENYLKNLARNAAERAKTTGEAQPLYNLTAGERRIIHLELASDPEVTTESVGEEPERYLIVQPKK